MSGKNDYRNPSIERARVGRFNMDTFSRDHLGIYGDKFSQFNRFRLANGQDYAIGGVAYVFFTKPDLNLLHADLSYDSFLSGLQLAASSAGAGSENIGRKIIGSLDQSAQWAGNTKFIPLLTNSVESIDTKDTVLETSDMSENFVGQKMSIPGTTLRSTTADSFSIEYTEYSDLAVTLLHKTWVDYINLVRRGILKAKASNRSARVLDWVSSVFYFKTDESGHRLRYFCKFTGVYPTNVPYSAFSWRQGDWSLKKVSIQYNYSFKEDMRPEILEDFERLTSSSRIAYGAEVLPDSAKHNWASNVGLRNGMLYFS